MPVPTDNIHAFTPGGTPSVSAEWVAPADEALQSAEPVVAVDIAAQFGNMMDLAALAQQSLDRYLVSPELPADQMIALADEARSALDGSDALVSGANQASTSHSKKDKQQEGNSPNDGKGSGDLELKNASMKPWSDEIVTAADLAGIAPEIIAGQVWHESRGNPNGSDSNSDGSTDLGLMRIGQKRWEKDVYPEISSSDKAAIKDATDTAAANLDMHKPLHNVIGGAFELNYWLDRADGDITRALNGYVSGNLSGHGPGDDNYANNVQRYARLIEQEKPLPDND